jgi:peptidoglycan/LPS O-acetylase OafA/YrhL
VKGGIPSATGRAPFRPRPDRATLTPRNDLGTLLAGKRLPALDGGRFVAVMIVLIGHAELMPYADLGVSGFFVLSGFLITWLLLKERDATGTVSLSAFYARRTLRIFPAYYVFLVSSFVLDRILGDPWPRALTVSAFTYTVNYFNATHGHPPTSVAHAWSLGVEEQFYLLWPLLFLLLARRGERALLWGACVTGGVVAIWRSVLFLKLGASTSYVYNAFETRFDSLAIGCILAIALRRASVREAAHLTARWAWLPLLTIIAIWMSRAGPMKYHYSIGFTVDAMLMAILIVQWLQLSQSALWSWLDMRLIAFLGLISYPMYLYHPWGLTFGEKLHMLPHGARFAIGAIATVCAALGSYYVVERPFLKLKKRFLRVPARDESRGTRVAES